MTDRELMLLDEPFQFLDEVQRKRVSDYLQSHMPEGATLILITHDDQELTDWAQKIKSIG
jgi:molybdate transport system ATP-binding protein